MAKLPIIWFILPAVATGQNTTALVLLSLKLKSNV